MAENERAASREGDPLQNFTPEGSGSTPTNADQAVTRIDYVLAEMRCAALRARLWQADIEAVGLALKHGLITPEQAIEALGPDARAFLGMRGLEGVS
jgi:predicted RNA-binding protein associated with RNAse of E/G family